MTQYDRSTNHKAMDLNVLDNLIKTQLSPLVEKIDREGMYPADFLRQLGHLGGYQAALGQTARGLADQTDVIATIAKTCGSTAFAAWCQSACLWYLQQSPRQAVKELYLNKVNSGKLLAGTGMSNTVKHLADIENHLLKAESNGRGGYVVKGTLPWVSNIGEEHIWAAAAQVDDGYIMFIVEGSQPGISLKRSPEFCALEGTATYSIKFDHVEIEADHLLADSHEFDHFISAIKPGFILLQMGMALGVIAASLDTIATANHNNGKVNEFLDNGWAILHGQYTQLQDRVRQLASDIYMNSVDSLAILENRLQGAELALTAAQSAALHAGAKGYLMKSPVQRRNREAMFVAIVTPAVKHLRKEIASLKTERYAA